jgi:hypothetical protein
MAKTEVATKPEPQPTIAPPQPQLPALAWIADPRYFRDVPNPNLTGGLCVSFATPGGNDPRLDISHSPRVSAFLTLHTNDLQKIVAAAALAVDSAIKTATETELATSPAAEVRKLLKDAQAGLAALDDKAATLVATALLTSAADKIDKALSSAAEAAVGDFKARQDALVDTWQQSREQLRVARERLQTLGKEATKAAAAREAVPLTGSLGAALAGIDAKLAAIATEKAAQAKAIEFLKKKEDDAFAQLTAEMKTWTDKIAKPLVARFEQERQQAVAELVKVIAPALDRALLATACVDRVRATVEAEIGMVFHGW